MAANNAAPDNPVPQKGFRIWRSVWPRRTGIGGYRRMQGALANLGMRCATQLVLRLRKSCYSCSEEKEDEALLRISDA